MHKYRILHIIGARPHFMKLAPISRAIAESEHFEEVVVHTGQHYSEELSEHFIQEFSLRQPDYRLGVGSATHCKQMGQIIIALDDVLKQENPDIVFVYGDTNSTAAGAIAAAKCNIPVAHIEAGLREWDKSIPEEVNKLLTDAVSDLFFCPTQTGVDNLKQSGITKHVFLVGDTVIDLIKHNASKISEVADAILSEMDVRSGNYYVLTCHRAANTNDAHHLDEILASTVNLGLPVIFPVHPRTRTAIDKKRLTATVQNDNLKEIDPQGFWRTQALIKHAKAVITDSGGVIKEAYFHNTPCVIVDRQTEWIEAVLEGWAVVTGPDAAAIEKALTEWKIPEQHTNILGRGNATTLILEHTLSFLNHLKTQNSN